MGEDPRSQRVPLSTGGWRRQVRGSAEAAPVGRDGRLEARQPRGALPAGSAPGRLVFPAVNGWGGANRAPLRFQKYPLPQSPRLALSLLIAPQNKQRSHFKLFTKKKKKPTIKKLSKKLPFFFPPALSTNVNRRFSSWLQKRGKKGRTADLIQCSSTKNSDRHKRKTRRERGRGGKKKRGKKGV